MVLTDTHTHLYSAEFDADRREMMRRAIDSGVSRMFVPAIDSTYAEAMFEVEKDYPGKVFLMMGLHPVYVKPESWERELKFVEAELARRKYVAVGEIGIDLYWDKSTLPIQQEAFARQIRLAKSHKLPINIHCRDAFDELFEVLESERGDGLRGILHCFTGDKAQAEQALSLNLKLGIGGVVTFKNGGVDKFLAEIPLKEIVLETDAPYLAPVPHRGKRNESAYITLVAQKVAGLYGLDVEEVAAVTTENSREIYGI